MNQPPTKKHRYRPAEVLPHRAPMLLVDEILDWGEDWITTRIRRIRSRAFSSMPAMDSGIAALEFLGQSAGAHAGIRQLEQDKPVILGFIIGTRAFRIDREAYLSRDEFEVHVEQTLRDSAGIGLYETRMYAPDRPRHTVAEAVIKAVMPDDPHEVFQGTMLGPKSTT